MMKPDTESIRRRLEQAFPDALLSVRDDSHLHAGHAGAQSGAGHFSVRIVSSAFTGLRPLARHRLVYDPLRDWMPDRIHALSIDARTPDEARD